MSDGNQPDHDRLVCVTGATGYVGSHVVRELLERGFRVRATVRDPRDEKKTAHLRSLPGAGALLELVSGDLEQPGSFDAAVAGCRYLIHTASAVVLTAKDPQREIVDVAVDGAVNVVKAAMASRSIERIVTTSSVAAVTPEEKPVETLFTEADWNDSATIKTDAYATSKVKAERAARALASEAKLPFIAILPSLILGPVMVEQHLRTSPAVVVELLKGAWPGVPNLHFDVVDVRDVAKVHVNALTVESPRDRYLCTNQGIGMRTMAGELSMAFPNAKIPSLPLPNFLMYATALFDKRLTFAFLKRNLGRSPLFDNRRMRVELGVEPRSVRTTVLDTGRSILDGRYLTKK